MHVYPCASMFSDMLHTYSYDYAFDAITEHINSMSFNIFLSWLKVFKYLRFVPFMRVLVSAFGNSLAQVILILGNYPRGSPLSDWKWEEKRSTLYIAG